MLAKRKMKLNDLATAVGISVPNLSILKTGKAKAIRFSTLNAICHALGDADWFGHGGCFFGYTSMTAYCPEERIALTVLTNLQREFGNPAAEIWTTLAVPEPSSWLLCMSAILAAVAVWWRRLHRRENCCP